jgi:cell division septum initiation protein DivIVA
MKFAHWPLQEEAGADKSAGGNGADKGTDLGTVEERAQRMGWTAKEKFRGDPERWVDAATFVKNGEESLPILRERLRTLEKTNVDLGKSVQEFKKMSDTAYERAYGKAKKELEAEVKRAAKAGDEVGAAAASTELADLEKDKATRDAAKDATDPVFEAWKGENAAWYEDADMQEEAELEGYRLAKRMREGKQAKVEGLPFLNLVKEAMKKKFPEKFGNPRRAAGSGVERSAAGGDDTGAKKGWDKLPPEAKEAGERYIKQKLYKSKDEYAKVYFEQN